MADCPPIRDNTIPQDFPACNYCGTCLAVCPVYGETGRETFSPRGKMALIRARREKTLPPSRRFQEILTQCLLCGACRINCPNGVPADHAIQEERVSLGKTMGMPGLRRLLVRHILPKAPVWKTLSHTQRLIYKSIPQERGIYLRLQGFLPPIAQRFFLDTFPGDKGIASDFPEIGYFVGCTANYIRPRIAFSTLRLIDQKSLWVPKEQTCCGLPAFTLGDLETAKQLARKNLTLFRGRSLKHVVTSCASCAAFLKQTLPLLFPPGNPDYEEARAFSEKVVELSSFLAGCGIGERPVSPYQNLSGRVYYHDPCHLKYRLQVTRAPRDLIKSKQGITLVNLQPNGPCCGNGGVYQLSHPETSGAISQRLWEKVMAGGADFFVTTCSGCLLQALRQKGKDPHFPEVLHLAELLVPGEP